MPRMPLSETSAKYAVLVACIVFAFVWLYNSYKLGTWKIKLTYRSQLLLCIFIILFANILTTLFKHWIYRSVGFVICGLLWIIHPVLIRHEDVSNVSKKTLLYVRLAGVVLILIGVFTRGHFY